MIYRIFFSLLIAVFIIKADVISGPAWGDQVTDTSRILAASGSTFEGLLAVKEADGVFLVRSEDGKKKRFSLNKNTTITRNGKPAAYGDLRSRDRVRVTYTSDFVVIEIQATGS